MKKPINKFILSTISILIFGLIILRNNILAYGVELNNTVYKSAEETLVFNTSRKKSDIRSRGYINTSNIKGPNKPISISKVIEEIEALPSKNDITLKNEIDIEKARSDYEKLTEYQRKLVGSVKKLIEAENALKILLQEKSNALNLVKYSLAKLPASEKEIKKITNKALLEKLINDVEISSNKAKTKGVTNTDIKLLTDYERLVIAKARLSELKSRNQY